MTSLFSNAVGRRTNSKEVKRDGSKEVPLLATDEGELPSDDRACFLCLEGHMEGDSLLPCCTRYRERLTFHAISMTVTYY